MDEVYTNVMAPNPAPGSGPSRGCFSDRNSGIGALWTIQLLGGLAARRSQQEVARFRTQKAASLLAFLAFHAGPRPHPSRATS